MNRLGDEPVEPKYKTAMEAVARGLDRIFNAEKRGPDRETGFVLLVFPFGETEGRCNYISNGADRTQIVTLLEEQAKRFRDQMEIEDK